MTTCAVLFVKNPEPGKVKTRLQSHFSAEQVARLYRAFVLDCATALEASGADIKVVAYTPIETEHALRALLTQVADFEYVPQVETDLGGRLEAMTQWGFAQGAERVVLLGSDSPSLPGEYIDRGFELLCKNEVVLGPSTDGGYCLVGRCRGESGIFTDVEWSTGSVLQQTLASLQGQTLGLLPPWYDVDTPSEAGFLKVHLEAMAMVGDRQGRYSMEVLRELDLPLPS